MTPVEVRPIASYVSTYAGTLSDSFASAPAVGSVVTAVGSSFNIGSAFSFGDNQGGANTWNIIAEVPQGDTNLCVAYCIVAASSGTFTVNMGCTNTPRSAALQIINWSAADFNIASLLGNYSISGATPLDRSVVTTVAGQLLISVAAGNGSGGDFTNPPSTLAASGEVNLSNCTMATAYKTCGSPGTEAVTWTGTSPSDSLGSILVSFMPGATDPAAASSRFNTSRHTFGTRR